jgi:hypothetical protein
MARLREFNRALGLFGTIARRQDRTAPWIVDTDGSSVRTAGPT